jgi:predicted transcriptional regulator
VDGVKHGRRTYLNHGCRCDVCRTAVREYARSYRGSVTKTQVPTSPGARLRAVERLIERHPEEFQRLLEDEVAGEVAS